MKRNIIETAIGALVLFVAAYFLVFSYKAANVGSVSGYTLTANFAGIGGLQTGDEVQISGVKVGSVAAVELDPDTYLARVTMSIEDDVKLPSDTAALISSESLLGGRYLSLEPGADDENMLESGGQIQYTQAPQNLEQLLGQFIFSMSDSDKEGGASSDTSSGGTSPDQLPEM
jgi:phospholipid/cholesterol/gamma-HCH transport system substrate-binding protein